MAYCPKCLIEYAKGSPECIDCHVPLEAGAPPAPKGAVKELEITPDVELVRVRTFSGPTGAMDAELAQNILQTQGIPCVLPGEGHAELFPGVDIVQLLVRKEDAERAEEILKSYLDNPENILPESGETPGA
jgi:Putative prokaryotic signal transducing protein